MFRSFKRLLLGHPLKNSEEIHERLTKVKALAVFSSDALSSVAYATEEIMLALMLAGTAALPWSLPIAAAVVALVAIVATSYRQTIHAYPSGGGSYIVAKDNLGIYPGLVAGAALLIDYVLTVSVSIAAGVAALTSAMPSLFEYKVALGLLFITLITLANLRGVKESGSIFAVPTYVFIGSMFWLIGTGLVHSFSPSPSPSFAPANPAAAAGLPQVQGLTLFLILRAFASGCTALTGVEAISNGVPAFQPPESRNASTTLAWLAVILAAMFTGITFLAHRFGVVPVHGETVVSQVARVVFGRGFPYFLVQLSTTMILVLAANTSYADFPRLASLMARDGYLPRQLANRGDRLVFSNGILTLGILSALLLVIFQGDTHALIPLYAVGVFLSFTLSQGGMVRHWLRCPGARAHALVNGVGAVTTALVLVVILITKFARGAWVVTILIPLLVAVFRSIHRHYQEVSQELSLPEAAPLQPVKNTVIVPVAGINKPVAAALSYAKSMSDNVVAVYVALNAESGKKMKEEWERWGCPVPLLVLHSSYRSLLGPLLHLIDRVDRRNRDSVITVVIPEFVPHCWWHNLLHNQSALLIKGALLFRKGVVVTSIPYHLAH